MYVWFFEFSSEHFIMSYWSIINNELSKIVVTCFFFICVSYDTFKKYIFNTAISYLPL